MSKKLNSQKINNLIIGSSIYSTGGGFDIATQQNYFKKIKDNLPELISIEDLNENDYICTAYAVGPAVADKVENKINYKSVLEEFEKITGKKIKAIFAGEINIEGLVFETASKLNLPVLDGDCCGGRAVPEIQMDTFFAQNIPITPALMVNSRGEQLLYHKTTDNFKLEKIARNFAVVSGTSVFILDHLVDIKTARKALTLGTLARSIKTGECIASLDLTQNNLTKICEETNSKLVFEGEVSEVNLKVENGFLVGNYSIKNSINQVAQIEVKNENMLLKIDDKIKVKAPNSIITIDTKKLFGIHNSSIKVGDIVAILTKECVESFRTENAKKLFE
jgi:uncharacterized protein